MFPTASECSKDHTSQGNGYTDMPHIFTIDERRLMVCSHVVFEGQRDGRTNYTYCGRLIDVTGEKFLRVTTCCGGEHLGVGDLDTLP